MRILASLIPLIHIAIMAMLFGLLAELKTSTPLLDEFVILDDWGTRTSLKFIAISCLMFVTLHDIACWCWDKLAKIDKVTSWEAPVVQSLVMVILWPIIMLVAQPAVTNGIGIVSQTALEILVASIPATLVSILLLAVTNNSADADETDIQKDATKAYFWRHGLAYFVPPICIAIGMKLVGLLAVFSEQNVQANMPVEALVVLLISTSLIGYCSFHVVRFTFQFLPTQSLGKQTQDGLAYWIGLSGLCLATLYYHRYAFLPQGFSLSEQFTHIVLVSLVMLGVSTVCTLPFFLMRKYPIEEAPHENNLLSARLF